MSEGSVGLRQELAGELERLAGEPWSHAWKSAVGRYQALFDAAPTIERAAMQQELSLIYLERAKKRNNHSAARFAGSLAEAAVASARALDDAELTARALSALGNSHFIRGDRFGDGDDWLVKAEAIFGEAVALLGPEASFSLLGPLHNDLAGVHASRHRRDYDERHLDAAVSIYRVVRRRAAREGRRLDWALAVSNIGRMQRDHADGQRDVAGLQRSATHIERAVRVLEGEKLLERAAEARHALAIAFAMRADIVYDRNILDRARALCEINCKHWLPATNFGQWARAQNTLAIVDFTIGEREGDPRRLRSSLDIFMRLVGDADTPSGQAEDAPWSRRRSPENFGIGLQNIASIRRRLAAIEGDAEHLRAALNAINRAATIYDPEHERLSHAEILHMRGGAESELGAMIGNVDLCAQGEATQRVALECFEALTPQPTARIALALNNLGDSLVLWHALDMHSETLGRAKTYFSRACSIDGGDVRTTAAQRTAINLVRVDFLAACRGSSLAQIESVARALNGLRDRMGRDIDPWEKIRLDLLEVDVRGAGHRIAPSMERRRILIALCEQLLSVASLPGPRVIELEIGLGWLWKLEGDLSRAIEVWNAAQLRLWQILIRSEGAGTRRDLARIATCRAGDSNRVDGIARGISLSDELALALLRRGQPGDVKAAVEAIERGRRMMRTATDLIERHETSQAGFSGLRNRYRTAAADLEALDLSGRDLGPRAIDERARLRSAARADYVSAERAITEFLAQKGVSLGGIADEAELASAIGRGAALVVMAVGSEGAAAVVVPAAGGRSVTYSVLELPELKRSIVDEMLLGRATSADTSGYHTTVRELGMLASRRISDAELYPAVQRVNERLVQIGSRLWQLALGPLDAHLRAHGVAIDTELAIMAPGILAELPIAAASCIEPDGSLKYFIQSWPLRFVPDIRSLILSRARAEDVKLEDASMLHVDTLGDRRDVRRSLDERPPEQVPRIEFLRGRDATVENVCKAMPEHPVFSFRGHGSFSWADPGQAGLELAGPTIVNNEERHTDRLTVARLRGLYSSRRRLAALAACETAVTSINEVSDEFESLASEFLEVGYAGVVASSWSVDSSATDEIMANFWEAIRDDGAATGASLARALRDSQVSWMKGASCDVSLSGLLRVDAVGTPTSSHDGFGSTGGLPPYSSPFWWAGYRLLGV